MAEQTWDPREHAALAGYAVKWFGLSALLSGAVGTACAFFLIALDRAGAMRYAQPGLLYALPLSGVAVTLLYRLAGKSADRGNNLILDEIHEPGAGVPARMGPLVLLGTVATHLCGGSAGREGTAVQMGGSLADFFSRLLGLNAADRRTLLTAGVAGGFAAVFGTPLAGAVFALEVLSVGSLKYDAVLPCLLAALLSDNACRLWGVTHTDYHLVLTAGQTGSLLKIAAAAVAFGAVAALFSQAVHRAKRLFDRIPQVWLRPVAAGGLVIVLTAALGTRQYLGLGVSSPDPKETTILTSFMAGGASPWAWLWKTIFTAVTLGGGFKGGEVTPLFYVGAALGHVLAGVLHQPVGLFAAAGFVAVFAGATNTPLACTIMGVELFGAEHLSAFAVACFVSYLFSGHSGIYSSQRVAARKGHP